MDRRSDEAQAYRRLYKTTRWRAIRLAHLDAEPLCRKCLARGIVNDGSLKPDGSWQPDPRRRFLVCDHIDPHRGDFELFFSGPFQTLCPDDHDRRKQGEEHRGFANDVGLDGWPVDAAHPANGAIRRKAIGTGRSHPIWFRESYIPLHIVCGPPGSGKSTFVNNHASPSDLIICFDRISASMFKRVGSSRAHASLTTEEVGRVLVARNEMLGDLMRAAARQKWPRAWLIVSEPRADHRAWWSERLRPAQIVLMETPAEICKARVASDALSGDVRHAKVAQTIDSWWASYSRRPGETIIRP